MKASDAASAEPRFPRGMSLTRKLPLQIGLLVTGIVALFLLMSTAEVRRLSWESNSNRLQRMNQEFAQISQNTQAQRRGALARAAADPALAGFLHGPGSDPDAVNAYLASVSGGDGLNTAQLWLPDGSPVGGVEEDLPMHRQAAKDFLAAGVIDSVRTGTLYRARDQIHFWTAAPISMQGEVLGYLALRRRIATAPGTEQRIRDIFGGPLSVYYASADGEVWSTALGEPAAPRADLSGVGELFRGTAPDGTEFVAHRAEVPGVPWVLVSELPESWILARSQRYLRSSLEMALMLVLLGATVAALMSLRLARPLRSLTGAAEAIAQGRYDVRSRVERTDEVGRLGAAFNAMAAQVERSRDALTRQFEEVRVLARELESSNRELDDARRSAERARREAEAAMLEAERARDDAQAGNRAKSRFLATMSHEIRTPINAIVGYTDLMEAQISGPITDRQRHHLERIRRSSDHLTGLVNELLDLSRIESGNLEPQRVVGDVAEAVATALALANPEADARGVAIEVDPARSQDAAYLGDPLRVRQILLNLMSNAVKFTPSGYPVTVTWGVAERDGAPGRWVRVTVEDPGAGIPHEDIERIFEPFVQLDSGYTRAHGGAGLGLTISRHLARLMGGDLTVTSAPGAGSRFTLWLPWVEGARGRDGAGGAVARSTGAGGATHPAPAHGEPGAAGARHLDAGTAAS